MSANTDQNNHDSYDQAADNVRPPLQPPPPARETSHHYSNPLASTLSYFTKPVAYTFSSVARRISVDDAPTPLAKALSANYNGSASSAAMDSGYYPTKRRLSPFQPPPLTPLSLRGYGDSTPARARLLKTAIAEEIRLLVPPRLQLMDHWTLVYSLDQHGSTLSTLYARCDAYRGKRGGFVVVVRDAGNNSFGAYLSDPPKPTPGYYGSGECFLWRVNLLPALPDLANLPPPPSADTTHLSGRVTTIALTPSANNSSASLASLNKPAAAAAAAPGASAKQNNGAKTPDRVRFKAFPYTGENDFTIFCQPEYLSVGGGDGHYGLWLGDGLSNGVSAPCPTFGNEPLSDEGSKFEVLGVEVWYVGGS